MDLDRLPPSILRFPGWSEPSLPFDRAVGSGREESLESGYLSLCGCSLEGGGESGGSEPGLWSPPEQGRVERRRKVEFFRKLGYSPREVLGALQKHGPEADTNTILGELVKHGAAPGEREREPAQATPEAPEAAEPPLSRARPAPSRPPTQPGPLDEQEGEHLRPIVIDGSNVAMRYVWAGCSRHWGAVGLGNVLGGRKQRSDHHARYFRDGGGGKLFPEGALALGGEIVWSELLPATGRQTYTYTHPLPPSFLVSGWLSHPLRVLTLCWT